MDGEILTEEHPVIEFLHHDQFCRYSEMKEEYSVHHEGETSV